MHCLARQVQTHGLPARTGAAVIGGCPSQGSAQGRCVLSPPCPRGSPTHMHVAATVPPTIQPATFHVRSTFIWCPMLPPVLQVAIMFSLYELAGVVTNLAAGGCRGGGVDSFACIMTS